MSEKRLFYHSLVASLLIHLSVILYFSFSKIKVLRKQAKQIELVYQKIRPRSTRVKTPPVRPVKAVQPAPLPSLIKEKRESFPEIKKEIEAMSPTMKTGPAHQKPMPKLPSLERGRKITVPMVKTEKMTNPKYLNYNERVREKIKQRAYVYVQHPDFKAGEVYLTFVLSSDGRVKLIRVAEERTQANDYLKKIGMRSIREAAPFPPFPKDLPYPELTFNVIISFEINDN